jgi:hypothetical protein
MKEIARNYLRFWFWIDLISILPFSKISSFIGNSGKHAKANAMVRVSKMGKIYKLVKLMRLFKIMKLVKNKDKLNSHLQKQLRISSGTERLLFVTICFVFFTHIFACLWLLLGQLDSDRQNTWYTPEVDDKTALEKYLVSVYFVCTTMTTVGYGDMTIGTT